MVAALLDQPPAYVAGPLLGLCVVALYALVNTRLGVVGGVAELLDRAGGRTAQVAARGWFTLGILGGGALFALLGGPVGSGYGWLTRELSGPAAAAVVLGSGLLIGFGAKVAGGCTSGNGLCGNATGSPASLAATATFFGTAVAVALATRLVFGAGL